MTSMNLQMVQRQMQNLRDRKFFLNFQVMERMDKAEEDIKKLKLSSGGSKVGK